MTVDLTENAPLKLSCESCGRDFECGANREKCWCFEIDLNEKSLAILQEKYKNCLCPTCLAKSKNNVGS